MPGGQVSEGNGVGIRIQAFFNGLLGVPGRVTVLQWPLGAGKRQNDGG